MFKHVLLFKFIDPEVCAPVVGQKLLALKETVPEIVEIEYGWTNCTRAGATTRP